MDAGDKGAIFLKTLESHEKSWAKYMSMQPAPHLQEFIGTLHHWKNEKAEKWISEELALGLKLE